MNAESSAARADHFASLEQEERAAHLGMWLFLTSEVLLFGALFGLYAAYRVSYGAEFSRALQENHVAIGTLNTAVLLTSSFSAAWAVHAVKNGRQRAIVTSLGATIVLGAIFLLLKAFEYESHFEHGIFPGGLYRYADLPTAGANVFFTLYFLMTGLHALHVIGGLTALAVVLVLAARKRYTEHAHTSLELSVLYWHLVDVIWIFLWPLMYFAGG
jgi:cytochrome c oxidase subunit III